MKLIKNMGYFLVLFSGAMLHESVATSAERALRAERSRLLEQPLQQATAQQQDIYVVNNTGQDIYGKFIVVSRSTDVSYGESTFYPQILKNKGCVKITITKPRALTERFYFEHKILFDNAPEKSSIERKRDIIRITQASGTKTLYYTVIATKSGIKIKKGSAPKDTASCETWGMIYWNEYIEAISKPPSALIKGIR